jgi:hypothetical protein
METPSKQQASANGQNRKRATVTVTVTYVEDPTSNFHTQTTKPEFQNIKTTLHPTTAEQHKCWLGRCKNYGPLTYSLCC